MDKKTTQGVFEVYLVLFVCCFSFMLSCRLLFVLLGFLGFFLGLLIIVLYNFIFITPCYYPFDIFKLLFFFIFFYFDIFVRTCNMHVNGFIYLYPLFASVCIQSVLCTLRSYQRSCRKSSLTEIKEPDDMTLLKKTKPLLI